MRQFNRLVCQVALLGLVLSGRGRQAAAELLPNQLTEAERRSGWQLLFDGASLDGFKGYQKDSPGNASNRRTDWD